VTDFTSVVRVLAEGGVARAQRRLPVRWDAAIVERALNFTLTSDIGDVDLLGEIVGGGSYEELLSHSMIVHVHGVGCRCLGLEALIQTKRAAGRPKDLEAIAELEALLDCAAPPAMLFSEERHGSHA